jgi:hypothetical protein
MQKIGFLFTVVLFAGCASNYYQRPESIDSKMQRYKSKNKNENIVPSLTVRPIHFSNQIKTTRTPASSNSKVALPQSNKKFYFLTLLGQYHSLSSYLPKQYKKKEINFCPHFHSSLVDYNENPNSQKKTSRLIDHKNLASWDSMKKFDASQYPELNLSISETEAEPRVVDIIGNEQERKKYSSPKDLVYRAMNTHLTKTYKELNTLCEYGNSANYYHYENLLGHIQRKGTQFKANTESIQILLKSTLYSNMTLLNSFENNRPNGRVPASAGTTVYTNPYHLELLNRLNAPWALNYLKESK